MKRAYTMANSAEIIGISEPRLRDWIKEGYVPFTPTISGKVAMTPNDIYLAAPFRLMKDDFGIGREKAGAYVELLSQCDIDTLPDHIVFTHQQNLSGRYNFKGFGDFNAVFNRLHH
jgi:hypothetical protein